MSSDPTQALMWAHHADQHRGLCLGFRQAAGSKLADPAHCLPVIYSDALPEMDGKGLQVTMSMAIDPSGRGYTSSFKLSFTDKTSAYDSLVEKRESMLAEFRPSIADLGERIVAMYQSWGRAEKAAE
jgi:hypothetical protein